jgi:phage FluMu protein Com
VTLPDVRCPDCHKLLCRGIYLALQILCPRCRRLYRPENTVEVALEQVQRAGQDKRLTPAPKRAIAFIDIL